MNGYKSLSFNRYLYKLTTSTEVPIINTVKCPGCDIKISYEKSQKVNWDFLIIRMPFKATGWYCPPCIKKLEKDEEGNYINQNNFNMLRTKIELDIGNGLK